MCCLSSSCAQNVRSLVALLSYLPPASPFATPFRSRVYHHTRLAHANVRTCARSTAITSPTSHDDLCHLATSHVRNLSQKKWWVSRRSFRSKMTITILMAGCLSRAAIASGPARTCMGELTKACAGEPKGTACTSCLGNIAATLEGLVREKTNPPP